MVQPVLPSPRLPRDTLIEIVRAISGVQCVWWTSKRPHLGQRVNTEHAWLLLSIQSYAEVGVDELRHQYDADLDQNDCLVVGQRQFTLTLNARSLDPSLHAYDLLERVRFRMRGLYARSLMIPIFAIRDFQAIVTLPDQERDERIIMAASMDVRMACVVSSDPLDPGVGDYIKTVDGGGTIPGTPEF